MPWHQGFRKIMRILSLALHVTGEEEGSLSSTFASAGFLSFRL